MLAAKFAFAVAPAAARDHCGDALIRAACENRDRGAEAAADQGDSCGSTSGRVRQIRERVAGIGDLIEADNLCRARLRCRRSRESRCAGSRSPIDKLLGDHRLAVAVLVAAEAVQNNECRSAFARRLYSAGVSISPAILKPVRPNRDFSSITSCSCLLATARSAHANRIKIGRPTAL